MDDEPARIGTVYQDPETGEYVMPADFEGDKELRWRPEDEIPADDSPEDYEVVSVSRTYRAPIPPPVPETGTIPLDEQRCFHRCDPEKRPCPGVDECMAEGYAALDRETARPSMPASSYVGLEEQIRLYKLRFEREVDRLWDALADPVYVRHIHDLGLERLIEGYKTFRDAMYQWPDHVRQAEMDEELADFIVYGTAEP
jgi:hypothetical protein